jgi:hypothetical protein
MVTKQGKQIIIGDWNGHVGKDSGNFERVNGGQ